MSRNLKREYLIKLKGIETKNGFKVDLANYIYNPSHEHEYPTLKKLISETPEKLTFTEFLFFKYYDGTGEYIKKTYSAPNNGNTWNVINQESEIVLEQNNRFSLNKLIKFAEV